MIVLVSPLPVVAVVGCVVLTGCVDTELIWGAIYPEMPKMEKTVAPRIFLEISDLAVPSVL